MGKLRVRVPAAMVVALLASVAMPVGKNSATAQNWEVASPFGTLVAFDRRDDQGLIYYRVRMTVHETPGKPYAADCSKSLVYSYDEVGRKWHTPFRTTELPTNSTMALGYRYACEKYGSKQPLPSQGVTGQPPSTTLAKPRQLVQLRLANVDDIGRAFVNGQQVSKIICSENTCTNDTGWIDVTKKMKPGRNTISFHLDNGKYGGWKYRFQLSAGNHKYDSGTVGRDACPCNAPVLKLQMEVLVNNDGDVESISKPDITYFTEPVPSARITTAQEIATDTDKRYSVEVPKNWTVESRKDDIDLKLGQVTIHVYPAWAKLTTLDAVMEDIIQHWKKEGITTGPKQRLTFPDGEALWTEAPGTERPYLGAVSRGGKFFFVNAEDKAKNSSGILEAFLAAVRSVRPAPPAAQITDTDKTDDGDWVDALLNYLACTSPNPEERKKCKPAGQGGSK